MVQFSDNNITLTFYCCIFNVVSQIILAPGAFVLHNKKHKIMNYISHKTII